MRRAKRRVKGLIKPIGRNIFILSLINRSMRLSAVFRFLLAFAFLSGFAAALHMLAPVDRQMDEGDVVYIDSIGPGQTIEVLIEETVKTGGRFGEGGILDQAVIEKVPPGWIGVPSKLYDRPLRVAVTADPEAEEGEYLVKIKVIDENNVDGLGEKSFFVKLNITYDVMDASVEPAYVKTGPGQPARFDITVNNKGATGDVFVIKSEGPKRWEFMRSIFVPAKSSKKISYQIVGNEEEVYRSRIVVQSAASPIIHYEKNITMVVESNIISDMKATNSGVLLFPVFESLVYSFFGLVSNLF